MDKGKKKYCPQQERMKYALCWYCPDRDKRVNCPFNKKNMKITKDGDL